MSSRAIIKADLLKLLPNLTDSQLPAELITLAETFITQSQNLYLNPSEVPAKSFVCTHLACDRLSLKLNLPELNLKNAPIPATKYKALFQRMRAESKFRQVTDSGRSGIDTRRRVARDLAKEVCTRLPVVPIAMLLEVLDRLISVRTNMTDTRAMVIAVFLLCLKTIKKTKTVSGSVQSSLIKAYGLTRQEVELEMEEVKKRSDGKDWFDISQMRKLKLGTEHAKKKARISQVRMVSTDLSTR